jgi:alpha-1,3-rhamnosyl/mannosyltransferase
MHDACFSGQLADQFDSRILNERAQSAARAAHSFIAVSSATCADVACAYGIEPRRIEVVHHGIAPIFNAREDAADASVREHLGLHGRRYFLCVSTHEPRKNLETLVQAFIELTRRLEATGPAAERPTLVLIGRRSAHSSSLDAILARSPAAAAQTLMLPAVSDAQLAALYRGAVATVAPSTCEGFGFPVVEALACGSAVVASDLPVFRELVGEAAVYVPPRDAGAWADELHTALEDSGRSAAARAEAASIANRYTWGAAARATFSVLLRAATMPG